MSEEFLETKLFRFIVVGMDAHKALRLQRLVHEDQPEGWRTHAIATPRQALKRLKGFDPHLVVLDCTDQGLIHSVSQVQVFHQDHDFAQAEFWALSNKGLGELDSFGFGSVIEACYGLRFLAENIVNEMERFHAKHSAQTF
jgi:hypothetical protein